ncbi:hypothetical protein C0Q70_12312 [Pomacea canaliculata]|uniref:Uncharacterized protein n=1 Tax=Pomacea canaliculata TaxID=400727 RepID=A0A2T7P161_POMCA|nr:hypothetical protein C0Q70_12312 [Pomacea canaliculata]
MQCFYLGLSLTPCGKDNITDVLDGHVTTFTCSGGVHQEGLEWRIVMADVTGTTLLGVCQAGTKSNTTTLRNVYLLTLCDEERTTVSVSLVNNTMRDKLVQTVNGSLQCGKQNIISCGLNFIYPAENVSCRGEKTSISVSVLCHIGRIYSSRRIYRCELFLSAKNGSLQTADMTTFTTSDKIAEDDVKVSGFCQFNISLPAEDHNSFYFVSVSPGRGSHVVMFPTSKQENTDDQTRETTAFNSKKIIIVTSSTVFVCAAGVLISVVAIHLHHFIKKKKRRALQRSQHQSSGETATIQPHGALGAKGENQQNPREEIFYEIPWDTDTRKPAWGVVQSPDIVLKHKSVVSCQGEDMSTKEGSHDDQTDNTSDTFPALKSLKVCSQRCVTMGTAIHSTMNSETSEARELE